MKHLRQLARDVYQNKSEVYENGVSGSDAIRNLMYDTMGIPVGTTGNDLYYAFKKNKYDLYTIINVAVDAVLPIILRNQFDSLANFHQIALGDELHFQNRENHLFRVAQMSGGHQDIRRQNDLSTTYKVGTEYFGAATYVEYEHFVTGQVDFNEYITRVAESFAVAIGERIYDAISKSYDGIRANRKHVGAGTVDLDKLQNIARHVKTASGGKAVTVFGTAQALSKISPDVNLMSDGMKDGFNKTGYLGTVGGLNLVAFPDAYRAGTEDFAVDDNALLIIPTGEKIVDVVTEGETQTVDGESQDNMGLQLDFNQRVKFGIGVRQASIYGYYKIG